MHKFFGDWYRKVSVEPSGEVLEKRWTGVEEITASATIKDALEFVRIFFSADLNSLAESVEKIRPAFQKADAAFMMRQNDLEIRILAGAAVMNIIDLGKSFADAVALGALAGDCAGKRTAVPVPEIIQLIKDYLIVRSGTLRAQTHFNPMQIPVLKQEKKQMEAIAAAGAENSATKLAELAKIILAEIFSSMKTTVTATQDGLNVINANLLLSREENNMLWWVFGEYSRDNDVHIGKFPLAGAALIAGKELSDLTVVLPGPVAAPALIDKMLSSVAEKSETNVTIEQAVTSTPEDWRRKWFWKESSNPDILCPLQFALRKSLETNWQASFEGTTGISASVSLPPLDVAIQIYRENLFMRSAQAVQKAQPASA